MSSVGLSGTSATLMWVAEHSSKVNATKRERMEEADARAKQVEDLNLLKEKLSTAKQSGKADDVRAAEKEIDTFLANHADDENIGELTEQLGEVKKNLAALSTDLAAKPDASDATATSNYNAAKGTWDKNLEDRMKTVDDLAQSIGQRDQIEMMRITTLDQAENRFYELGSNKIANDGKTANALIGNIRV